MTEENGSDINEGDLMKIMVATDIHLGFCEKDSVRGEDSFIAFEEILELAVEHDVDFILLGGDLFHDANPTQNALNKCLKLLRRYTLGDKPIMLEFLSDQSLNFFDSLNRTVNYEDPNMNISIPVFSIHGNHDDPSGFGRISSLDILSTTGLINYFGKWVDLTKIEINPVMMKKGETQLALYGLSHIHDARLVRLFHDAKVVMEKADEKTGDWFNIMVLHQNRADRGPKNYLPEEILPEFLDLVIWGHEHDCRIIPEENFARNFFVVQPGSSVATSLAEGESLEKHCGILLVHKKQFKLEPIALKTVRPFIFESINLAEYVEEYGLDEGDAAEKVMEIVTEKIESMLQKVEEKISDDPRQPKLPLIRLRIFYTSEEQMFSQIRFGQQYSDKVANPMDMLLFKRVTRKPKFEVKGVDKDAMDDVFDQETLSTETRVEDMVDRYFEEVEDSKQLQVIASKSLSELCRRLVESNDDDAADNIIRFYKDAANSFLEKNLLDEENLEEELAKFRQNADETHDNALQALDKRGLKGSIGRSTFLSGSDDDSSLITNGKSKASDTTKKPARGGKKASESTRGSSRGRGRGRGAVKTELDISVNKKAGKQQTLAESLSQTSTRRGGRSKAIVYEVSDSD